jgi:predicted CXXCH cytochrome family protein
LEVQLRQLRQGPDGTPEYADAELSAETVTIGSAADQQVQLLGRDIAAAHAVIKGSGSSLTITARGSARLRVNGRFSRASRLKPKDVIEIAGNRISVTAPPPGFDLALTIELDAQVKKSEFESAFRTEIDQTWLSKRRTAWALFVVTPLVIFLIPFGATLMQREGRPLPGWLLDDGFWSAGPLTPAHAQAAGRRCEACHLEFFVHVKDQECRKCHTNIVDHVTSEHLTQTKLGPTARCGECHEEHNSAGGSLVVRAESLCVKCHARSEQLFGSLQLEAVSGFSQSRHPTFRATVLRPTAVAGAALASLAGQSSPAGAETVVWRTVQVPVAGGLETSNLKFSHAEHLDGSRVQRRADSKPLECADCHALESDGAHFAPVTMATSCSGCHELTFDERAPDRQLPHGKPRDAILLIQDYYAHKYMDGATVDEGPIRRRLPDSSAAQQVVCTGPPAQRGACRAQVEILTQFTRRGCVSCHEVTDHGGAVLQERFTVRPVRLVSDYLPGVHFSHRTHAVQKNLTGQAACLSCHGAKDSKDSRPLMIPDRGKCLECHGDTVARDRVELQCVSCHAYHADHSERPSPQTL